MSAAPAHPHAWSLHVAVDRSSGEATLVVRGRIGSAGAGDLGAAIRESAVAGERLLLDLEAVDYISSAGLAVLQDAARHVHEAGGCLELARASEPVKMALRLAGPIPHLKLEFRS
jgi:anti-anti-sigma factor